MKLSSTFLVRFGLLALACSALHCSNGNSADGGMNDRQEDFETSEGALTEVDLGPNDCGFEAKAYKPNGELIQVMSQDGADCVKMKRKVKEGLWGPVDVYPVNP